MLEIKPHLPVKFDCCNITNQFKQQKALNISVVFSKYFSMSNLMLMKAELF